MRPILFLLAALISAVPFLAASQQNLSLLQGDETPLRALANGDEGKGWEGVGRLNLGDRGFCTAVLIAPNEVLTAAHCMYDKSTGKRFPVSEFTFLAGYRTGRAAAYRGIKRAVVHPDYVYGSHDDMERVSYDLALLELDQPIRLPSIQPFETDTNPVIGDAVGVVSYAQDRADAPSLQQVCHVLGRETGVVVLNCSVDFGSSGAPIFSIHDGRARVVSIVSAKAEVNGKPVALGVAMDRPLETLRAELAQGDVGAFRKVTVVGQGSGAALPVQSGGAKFLKP